MEIWKSIPLPPWNDRYEISNLGRVRVAGKRGKVKRADGIIAQRAASNGYRLATLNPGKRTIGVHQLVAMAFHGMPDNKFAVVNHLNFDRTDNRPENLEWSTRGLNNSHSTVNGRHAVYPNHPVYKADPKAVFELHSQGCFSYKQIADRFGVSKSAIYAMLKRDYLKKRRQDILKSR